MAADLDGQVAPVRVEDVKRVVVHIRHRLLFFDVVSRADIPHRRLRPTDQNQKQTLGHRRLGQIFFRKLRLALSCRTVDHGNEAPPNWWTPLLSSGGCGKWANWPGAASFYGLAQVGTVRP